jgi:peptidyl-prolyl cis-trans isomerase SurA
MKKINLLLVSLLSCGFALNSIAADAEQSTTAEPAKKVVKTSEHSEAKQPLDRIVAIVNESVITNNELDTQVSLVKETLTKRNMPIPPEKILRKQVLEHMIDTELEMQMAKNAGIDVDSQDIDEAIERIAKQNNVSVEDLHKVIASQGITWKEYRRSIKKEMTVSQLQQKAVGSILVTDQEVENFLASNAGSLSSKISESFHLEDILIPLPADPSSQDVQAAQQRAYSVLTRLKNGANFNEIAIAESSGSDALQGGDLGFRQLPELPEAFAAAVVNMKPGDLSDPIRTSNGWHIIKLVAVEGGGSSVGVPDKEQVRKMLYQRKFNEALENWMLKIRGTSYIQTFL